MSNPIDHLKEIADQLEKDILGLIVAVVEARNLPEGPIEDPLFASALVNLKRLKLGITRGLLSDKAVETIEKRLRILGGYVPLG
jgi:hypothetical protein